MYLVGDDGDAVVAGQLADLRKSLPVPDDAGGVLGVAEQQQRPKWLDGLKRHGFRGAQDVSQLFDYVMGWSATSDVIEKWMFDSMAERFVLDEETREWIMRENPYAMMNMVDRLEEAVSRGLWNADEEMMARLDALYDDVEGALEDLTDGPGTARRPSSGGS